MTEYALSTGSGRTAITLRAVFLGEEMVVIIFNSAAHIGAVAIGEYDPEHKRVSVSVVTRLGHKDDAIAQQAAYDISKATLKAACVIAGVHLDDIQPQEIEELLANSRRIVEELVKLYPSVK